MLISVSVFFWTGVRLLEKLIKGIQISAFGKVFSSFSTALLMSSQVVGAWSLRELVPKPSRISFTCGWVSRSLMIAGTWQNLPPG